MSAVLFDIDGTLISTGGAGGAALLEAFSTEFGVENPGPVPFSGRTDRGIARDLFVLHGIEDAEHNWVRLRDGYLSRLGHFLPRRKGHVLPGVAPLLDSLAARDDLAMGLLTGNMRDGAKMKLTHYELFHHFEFGGFGDDHHHRDDVAHAALRDTRRHLERDVHERRVWIVGDTPLDVRCARAIGARVLAVATGLHPKEELAEENPDLLLDDLREPAVFLDALDAA